MNTTNKNITFMGNALTVEGNVVKVGDRAPDFKLVGLDMKDLDWSAYADKVLIISVVPSLDTPTCQVQTKRFNQEAAGLSGDVVILTVSLDLPFAQKRWCGAEGIARVVAASDYKYRTFGSSYGCYIQEMGLLARAVFVVAKDRTVRHVEYVTAISDEPNYDAALKAVSAILG